MTEEDFKQAIFVFSDARTMNLVIYRCKAFLNRMRKMIAAKERHSPGQFAVCFLVNSGKIAGDVIARLDCN